MKNSILSLICLGLLFSALWANPIPYPADSEAYNAVKQSRIGSAVEQDYRSTSGIMQSIEYRQETRNGLLVPVDGTFTLALSGNDDSSTSAIQLPFVFDFYGSPQTEFYINNNGNISFGDPYSTYSSTGFPITEFPMFAAFWADVDTRPAGSGKVYYKVEPHRVIVSWNQVGYFSNHIDKTNSFQIIFTDATDPLIGIGNNIAFSYADMQWTTGDASSGTNGFGGIPATVGLNQGDGLHYALIGRFDHAGTDYSGPAGAPSGVSYLDNQLFIFSAQSMAIPPFFTGLPQGGIELRVGQSVSYQISVNSAILENMVSATIAHDFSSGFSYSVIPGNPCQISITIEGRLDNRGLHTVTIDAIDGGNPALSSSATIVLNISGELNDFLITANQLEGSINILDVNTRQVYGPYLQGQLGGAGLYDLAISADGSFALISNFDNYRVYQLELSELLSPVVSGNYYLGFAAEDISLSKDDRFALVADGGSATSIAVLDLQSRTTVQILNIAPHYAQGVEIGPDGKVLINDFTNGKIHQYLLNQQSGILSYSGVSIPVLDCINTAIHPSGKFAIASSFSGSNKVLQLNADNSISTLQSINSYGAQSAIYSRNGKLAIIAEFGLASDVLSVYNVSENGSLVLRNSYPLPRNSGGGFYGVDTVALSTDNSKAFVGSFYSDDFSPLCYVNLITHTVQELNVPGPAGIGIGKQGIQAFFSAETTQFVDHSQVQFHDLSYGNPDSWVWNFGDGQSSSEVNPNHIYDEPGFYTVTLTIHKGMQSSSYSQQIHAVFDTDIHLSLLSSPYQLYSDLLISENSSLTIDPGVEIQFGPQAGLSIFGSLIANDVLFTGDETLGWKGISIDSRHQSLQINGSDILNAVIGLKVTNSSFQINNLEISKTQDFPQESGMRIVGACNMILNNIEIDGYNPGIVFQNEQRISSSPLLTNIRIRNSSSTSRNAGTGIEVLGAVALQLDDVEIDDYDTGIDWDAQGFNFERTTPLLTNIRIRNSSSTSRIAGKGIKIIGGGALQLNDVEIENYDTGIDWDSPSELATPLLTNIRIRNSSSTSRTAAKGIKIIGGGTLQLNDVEIENYDTGIDWDSPNELATPLLTNIRIRNSSSTSRAAAKGIKIVGGGAMQINDVEIDNCNTGIDWDAQDQPYLASTPLLTNIRIRNSSSTSRQDFKGVYLKNISAAQCSLLVISAQNDSDRQSNIQGSGIIIEDSNATIRKSTVWGLEHGLHLVGAADATFVKSIIWSAADSLELTEPVLIESGQATVQQSNISYAAGVYAGQLNTDLNPKFVNPQGGNFYLKLRSPLRHTGIGARPFDFAVLATDFQRTFTPGWNMCGVPVVTPDNQNTPTAIFGSALAPFYVSPYYTSILQLTENSSDNLGHLVFPNSSGYSVPEHVYPSVGYWVRNPNPHSVELSVYGIMDDEDYLLELRGVNVATQGHFMLANPYDRPLSLNNGIILEGLFNSMIWLYDPSTNGMPLLNLNDPTTVIPPWAAFIIKANAFTDKVHFSYPNAPRERSINSQTPLASSNKPKTVNWEIYLKAEAAENEAVAVMGIAKDASDGHDPMDIPEVPFSPIPSPLSLYVQNSDWENIGTNYVRDIKSDEGNLWQWQLQLDLSNLLVDGQYTGTVKLDLLQGQKIPANYSYRLTDPGSGQCVDLRTGSLILNLDIDAYSEESDSCIYSLLLEARLETPEIGESQHTLGLSNYPNPFNPSTTFAYSLPEAGKVELTLFNIKGQKVRALLSEHQDSGLHSVVWDGKDENGKTCASGFYFCRINTPSGSLNKKILMLK